MSLKSSLKQGFKQLKHGVTASAIALTLQQTPALSQIITNNSALTHTVQKGETLYNILLRHGFSKQDPHFQEFIQKFQRDILDEHQTLMPGDMISIQDNTLSITRNGITIFKTTYTQLAQLTSVRIPHPEIIFKTQQALTSTFHLKKPQTQLLQQPISKISRILKKRSHIVEMIIKDHKDFQYHLLKPQDLIILGLMESKLNPKAISPTGAKGLMQITGVVIEDIREHDKKFFIPKNIKKRHGLKQEFLYDSKKTWLLDPGKNFTIGATYLKYLEGFSSDTIHKKETITQPTLLKVKRFPKQMFEGLLHDSTHKEDTTNQQIFIQDNATQSLDSLELSTLLDSSQVLIPLLKAKRLPEHTIQALTRPKNFQTHSKIKLNKHLKKMRIKLPKKDFEKNFQAMIEKLKTDDTTKIKFTIARNYNGDTTMLDQKRRIRVQDIYALKFLYLSLFVFKDPEEITSQDSPDGGQ